MKSLFSSSFAILTGLLVLTWSFMLAETFTEGVRVSPETVSRSPANMFGNLNARLKDHF